MANSTQDGQTGNRTIIIPPGSLNPDEVNVVYIPPSLHNTSHPLLVRPASGRNRHFQALPLPIWNDELSRRDEGNDTHSSAFTQGSRSIPGDSGYEADISAFGTTFAESVRTSGNLSAVSGGENVEYKKMCSNVTAGGSRTPNITHMSSRSLKTSSDSPSEGVAININAPGGVNTRGIEKILENSRRSASGSPSCPPVCGPSGQNQDDDLNFSGFQPPLNSTFQEPVPDSYYADMYDKPSGPRNSNDWPLSSTEDSSSFGPSNTYPYEFSRMKLPTKTYHGCVSVRPPAAPAAQGTFARPGPPAAQGTFARPGPQPANATFAPAGRGTQPVNATFAPAGCGSQPMNATHAAAPANATYAPANATNAPANATYAPEEDCICPGEDPDYDDFDPEFVSTDRSATPESFYDDLWDSECYSSEANASGDLNDSVFARVMGGEFNVITPMTPSPTRPAKAPCPQTCASWENRGSKCYDVQGNAVNATQSNASQRSPHADRTGSSASASKRQGNASRQGSPHANRTGSSASASKRQDNATCGAPALAKSTSRSPAQRNASFAGPAPAQGNVTRDAPASGSQLMNATNAAAPSCPPTCGPSDQNQDDDLNFSGFQPPLNSTFQEPVPDSYYADMYDKPSGPRNSNDWPLSSTEDSSSFGPSNTYPYEFSRMKLPTKTYHGCVSVRPPAAPAAQGTFARPAQGTFARPAQAQPANVTQGNAPCGAPGLAKNAIQAPGDRFSRSMNATYPFESEGRGSQRTDTTCPPALIGQGPRQGNATFAPAGPGRQPMNATFAPAGRGTQPVNATFAPAGCGSQPMNATRAAAPANATYAPANATYAPGNASYAPEEDDCICPGEDPDYDDFDPEFVSTDRSATPESFYDDLWDSECYSSEANASGDLDDSVFARVMGGEFNVITPMTPSPTKPGASQGTQCGAPQGNRSAQQMNATQARANATRAGNAPNYGVDFNISAPQPSTDVECGCDNLNMTV